MLTASVSQNIRGSTDPPDPPGPPRYFAPAGVAPVIDHFYGLCQVYLGHFLPILKNDGFQRDDFYKYTNSTYLLMASK